MVAGKKAKKLEKDGTQAQKNKQVKLHTSSPLLHAVDTVYLSVCLVPNLSALSQELMLNRRQNAKAQARKNARAFKELDTTLQVLGINGKQAALEAPAADLQASRKAQKAVSEASRSVRLPCTIAFSASAAVSMCLLACSISSFCWFSGCSQGRWLILFILSQRSK